MNAAIIYVMRHGKLSRLSGILEWRKTRKNFVLVKILTLLIFGEIRLLVECSN
jgi:hypothetical protein